MLDIAILLILVIGFFVGLKRGFILQLIHITGFIIAFIVAHMYYDELAPKLNLWIPYPSLGDDSSLSMLLDGMNVEDVYYRAIAFAIIFFAVKVILHIIGTALDFVAKFPILKQLNIWAGGILGLIEVYLVIFLLLYIGALLPVESIQNALNQSIVAEAMVKNTPLLSSQLKDWWMATVS